MKAESRQIPQKLAARPKFVYCTHSTNKTKRLPRGGALVFFLSLKSTKKLAILLLRTEKMKLKLPGSTVPRMLLFFGLKRRRRCL